MARSVFGNNASAIGRIRDICCAVDCRESSITTIATLTLCARHVNQAYADLERFMAKSPLANSIDISEPRGVFADERQLTFEEWHLAFEPIKQPHGICPKCDRIGLARYRETGAVYCIHKGCGHEATPAAFRALCQARDREAAARARTEVVYYIRFGDRVKIGTTRDIERRLIELPHDELMATEPGGTSVERKRHAQFKHLRARSGHSREWFDLTPELADHIAQVRSRMASAAH